MIKSHRKKDEAKLSHHDLWTIIRNWAGNEASMVLHHVPLEIKLAYQEAHEFRGREENGACSDVLLQNIDLNRRGFDLIDKHDENIWHDRHGSQANQNAEQNRAQVCTTYTCIFELDFQMPALPLEAALACLQGVTSHYVEKFSDQALMLPIDKRSMETMVLNFQALLNVFLA